MEDELQSWIEKAPERYERVFAIYETALEKEVISWEDISDEATTEEWGKLIEWGYLKEIENREYKLCHVEEITEVLDSVEEENTESETQNSQSIETPDISWRTRDKALGVLVIFLFASYNIAIFRNTISSVVGVVFDPVLGRLPFYATLIVLSVCTALYALLVRHWLLDTKKLGKVQKRLQLVQDELKDSDSDTDVEALFEAMKALYKGQLRPMMWILVITLPIFMWLRTQIEGGVTPASLSYPVLGSVEWAASIIGPIQAWIVFYVIFSLVSSLVLRRVLDLDVTPDIPEE